MKDSATEAIDKTEKTVNQAESFLGEDGESDAGHGHKMRSGQGWGKGIVADVKRTILTHWKKEMTNLNGKVSLQGFVQFIYLFLLFYSQLNFWWLL